MEPRTEPVRPPEDGHRPALTVVVVAVVLVTIAVIKPWPGPIPFALPAAAPAGTPVAIPSTTPGPPSDDALVDAFCLQPSGWRIYAAERWSDRDVRSWRSADAIAGATGPSDPRIPVTPLASHWIMSLGYCAPISGVDRPPAEAAVTVFQVPDAGSAAPELLALQRLQPALRASALGAVFAPPSGPRGGKTGPASGWQDGTYVFRIGGATRDNFVRWLGVRVEILPPLDRRIGENPPSIQP
jgi:hypothetical protein